MPKKANRELLMANGKPRCQALSRQRQAQCAQPARLGFSVCGAHGAGFANRELAGVRQSPATASYKTGRWSKLANEKLAERIAKFQSDAQPLDMLADIATMRALTEDFIERCSNGSTDAEVAEAVKLLAEASKAVERVAKLELARGVPRAFFLQFMDELAQATRRVEGMTDELWERVNEQWKQLGRKLAVKLATTQGG